jgi:hypothetical protein
MKQIGVAKPEEFACSLAMELEETLEKVGLKGQAVIQLANTGLDQLHKEWCPTVWKVNGLPLQLMAKALWFGLITDLTSYRRDYMGAAGPPAYCLIHRDLGLDKQHLIHGHLWDEDEVRDLLIAVVFHDFYQLPVQNLEQLPVPSLEVGQFPYYPTTDNTPYRVHCQYPGIHYVEAGVDTGQQGVHQPKPEHTEDSGLQDMYVPDEDAALENED